MGGQYLCISRNVLIKKVALVQSSYYYIYVDVFHLFVILFGKGKIVVCRIKTVIPTLILFYFFIFGHEFSRAEYCGTDFR